ncbi:MULTISPECIES: transposase [unclassified Variovorax]|uniref:IS66 family transposase n=1 Tax=unclassified Variovorax TaxID=663243 RepID=UPI000B871406
MIRDEYKAYDSVISAEPGLAAGCLAHVQCKFDELLREGGRSAVATEALQRIAQIYRVERKLAEFTARARLDSMSSMVSAVAVGVRHHRAPCQARSMRHECARMAAV